jgi:hypothetical protein
MNRTILTLILMTAGTAALGAQQASQSNPYEGTSNPPPDDTIITSSTPQPKPPAARAVSAAPAAPAPLPPQAEPAPASIAPSTDLPAPGNDDGIVQVAPNPPAQPNQPMLSERAYVSDPDGDIVHPRPLRPGELDEGTTIRVHLLEGLSTTDSERGQPFRTTVATDVLQGGQVLIPAGAEIDGTVAQVSSGHAGGYGSMRLRPETVILPDGTRFRLAAETTGTPGSRTHVVGEGTIRPDSRLKRDSIEYGGAVGAGLVTGAVLGGPAGALAGGLIGAGAVTAHLLVSHPQARLDSGTTLLFTLTEPLDMVPAPPSAN